MPRQICVWIVIYAKEYIMLKEMPNDTYLLVEEAIYVYYDSRSADTSNF
jgi:hypothetical protein